MSEGTRVIKKYPNRKLYDTSLRRYVTLSHVESLVVAGETVQVVDQASGADITEATLAQLETNLRGSRQPVRPVATGPVRRDVPITWLMRTSLGLSRQLGVRAFEAIETGRALVPMLPAPSLNRAPRGAGALAGRVAELEAQVAELSRELRALRDEDPVAVP